MEAPVPSLASSTPGNLSTNMPKDIISKSTEYKFKFNNKNFTILIGMTSQKDYLIIQSKEEDVIAYIFERKMFLSELVELDKMFKTCDTIEESYNLMIQILNGETNKIKEIVDDKLILCISILNLDKTYREKEIEIFKKRENNEILIETLCKQVVDLKTINKNLQNEINDLKKRLEKIEDKINFKLNSNIIKEKSEYDFIVDRLKKVEVNQDGNNNVIKPEDKNIGLILLYKASRDGDKAKDFHSKCDNFKNTLIIIKTKKGLRFGGFTCQKWDGNGDKKDKNAFCFSLDKSKIYNWKKGRSSIFVSPESGPVFGNCVFELRDQFFEMGGLCSEDFFYDNQANQCEINNGEEQFDVEEIEVFSVTF